MNLKLKECQDQIYKFERSTKGSYNKFFNYIAPKKFPNKFSRLSAMNLNDSSLLNNSNVDFEAIGVKLAESFVPMIIKEKETEKIYERHQRKLKEREKYIKRCKDLARNRSQKRLKDLLKFPISTEEINRQQIKNYEKKYSKKKIKRWGKREVNTILIQSIRNFGIHKAVS